MTAVFFFVYFSVLIFKNAFKQVTNYYPHLNNLLATIKTVFKIINQNHGQLILIFCLTNKLQLVTQYITSSSMQNLRISLRKLL